ncbi:MAG: argininosuccinate lyase [Phycisphaerales bacterium]|nr:argininosuccinate lyase [Phycisphaerales bacterium]
MGTPSAGGPGAPGAMWGGRFAAPADPLFRAVNDSLGVDWRLAREDIQGSIAWASGLERAGVLSRAEYDRLVEALKTVEHEAAECAGSPVESGAEDVHSWVEQRLIALVGDLGKKLHTGRSRNDQVATDFRLWLRAALDERAAELRAVRAALLRLAQRHDGVVMPGYTHLQRAQPILLAHWALAYEEMLFRDTARLRDARARVDECPLGCGALAGTAYPVDRAAIARDLAFAGPCANSLDAVASRDFALEALAASAICGVTLSRLAEDLILYFTDEFAFLRIADSMTSGSSLMPQKKNPDAIELLRAKCGRLCAEFQALAVVMKGLPLAYNKDMQEDKRGTFAAMDELSICLRVGARMLDAATFEAARCRTAALGGYANATDLADYLVERGVPFREAHDRVGRLVRVALARSVPLEDLPLETLRETCPELDEGVYARLSPEACLERRAALGGTAPQRVGEALRRSLARLEHEEAGQR